MAASTYVDAMRLAQEANLSLVEVVTPRGGKVYRVLRAFDVLHSSDDLHDVHGWLKAWLSYVR